ncbi:MAG: type I DNA topoisomerase [Dehalococcoidia bacterium]|nr:MAG: type I DNA topoisomerase [Dehalococcoidia bacterium]
MKKNLVVVESPAKARTLSQFLGKEYILKASMGHVRDLPTKELGVDMNNDFSPKYIVLANKKKVISEIKGGGADAAAVYLATDPDREGEAISWHVVQAAKLGKVPVKRVVFHEITRDAIDHAFRHPRPIDMKLVDAQQARRILDRLVGYKLSPLLWKRVRPGLSAGRVQSVALKLIVDREAEITDFIPKEYWVIEAELAKEGAKPPQFRAVLVSLFSGGKIDLRNEEQTQKLVNELRAANYSVSMVAEKRNARQPAPPFITSTLQQEAWRKLRFSAKQTMAIAQQLYEGLPLGDEGHVGLITYMRTDSTRVSPAAITDTRVYIEEKYGGDYLPSSPRRFAKKVKGAQEAHEAIRPTSIRREPALIEAYLKKDQLKLYNLIWQRMVSSQMAAAQIDTTTVDIKAKSDKNSYLFKAKRSVVAFPGFFILYQEGKDEDDDENGKAPLPELTKGDVLKLQKLLPEQRFTQPPLRYSEATLVKVLEELGIGRPSTYAPILSLIQERGYVERANGKLLPTELGAIVSGLLSEHFADIVNVGFTAQMEEKLDQIASGQLEWVPMLKEFYNPFEELVVRATSTIPKVSQQTDEICDICGRPMVIKWGRRGKFLSCSGFPECKNAKPIIVTAGANCPQCGAEMLERRSKKGKLFYGCSQFPKCKFATWDKPLTQPCPQCQGLLTASKKGTAKCTQCEYEGELGSVE